MHAIQKRDVQKLVGQRIYALKKDGTLATGKLVRIKGNQLYLEQVKGGKRVKTSAIASLALYDLLALGTFGAYGGYGYPGYLYGGYGYPYGGFIW